MVFHLPRKHHGPKTKSEGHSALEGDSIMLAISHRDGKCILSYEAKYEISLKCSNRNSFSVFYTRSCEVTTTRGVLQSVHVRGRQGTATCDVTAHGGPCPSRERLYPSRCQGDALTT